MTLSLSKRALIGTLVTCVALAVANASFVESLLQVQLFEVGSLWIRAIKNFASKITNFIFQVPDFYDPYTYLWGALISVGLYVWYYIFHRPLNRVRALGDCGYIPEGPLKMKDMVNIVRRRRKLGEMPPVYPNGWFSLLESRDLKVGESKSISILGLNIAVFRGEDGQAHAVDAYCPHLGADLGVGGQVKGDCIECPFHGWLFRGEDGKCVDIPYCRNQKIPEVAHLKSYTIMERNHFIYVWFDAEGREPHWEPDEIEEIKNGSWAYRGRTEHVVNCHIEDVPENGADVSHLPQVHGPFMTSGIDLRYTYSKIWSFAKHHWDGFWHQSTEPNEKHVGTLSLTHSMSFFGIRIPILDMKVKARQTGPGIVYLTFESMVGNGAYLHHITPMGPMTHKVVHQIYFSRFTPQIFPTFFLLAEALMMGPGIVYLMLDSLVFGKGTFLHHITPTGPVTQSIVHQVYLNRWTPSIVGKIFLLSEAIMIERDVMIWNNKRYNYKPVFVKSESDSLLARHRRWYSQFYSENSPRLDTKTASMDW